MGLPPLGQEGQASHSSHSSLLMQHKLGGRGNPLEGNAPSLYQAHPPIQGNVVGRV